MTTIPHLAFVGFSGSGKTTLLSQVVIQLKRRGYRIGVLKHDAHDFQMDVKGKDTYQYSEAGADLVAISSAAKFNMMERLQKPLALEEVLQRFRGVDLILIEGYKQANVPKILVARTSEQLALYEQLSQVMAIASTFGMNSSEASSLILSVDRVPFLDLNDIAAMTTFVESWLQDQHSFGN
ncbi:MAG: molybdopterin-guanine dinucleotide biosynthesis protein B [Paenibacillaceae bacterium]